MRDRSGVTPLGDRDRDRMVAFFRRDLPLHIYARKEADYDEVTLSARA